MVEVGHGVLAVAGVVKVGVGSMVEVKKVVKVEEGKLVEGGSAGSSGGGEGRGGTSSQRSSQRNDDGWAQVLKSGL